MDENHLWKEIHDYEYVPHYSLFSLRESQKTLKYITTHLYPSIHLLVHDTFT